jgi:hypothetical protein
LRPGADGYYCCDFHIPNIIWLIFPCIVYYIILCV